MADLDFGNVQNHAPQAMGDSLTVAEDTMLVGDAAAHDDDGDKLTITLVRDAVHGTLTLESDGSFTYRSDGGFLGTDTFTYKANDGLADSNVAMVSITVTEAAEKYNVYRTTIIRWKGKGYIGVIQPGYRMTLNEAEVAYCAAIHHERKASGLGYRGVPLLDDEGLPYKLKHPELSRYRRDKSQKKRL